MINQETLDTIGRNGKYCFTKAGQLFLLWAMFLYLFACLMAGPVGPKGFIDFVHYGSHWTGPDRRPPVIRAYDGR
jgi:hypothetical protein